MHQSNGVSLLGKGLGSQLMMVRRYEQLSASVPVFAIAVFASARRYPTKGKTKGVCCELESLE